MLDRLSLPPRLVLRALDDLHTLATALPELIKSVRVLPRTEDELSASVADLKVEVQRLQQWLQPLHTELTDLDDTAEKLETALNEVNAQIQHLRDRIPGL